MEGAKRTGSTADVAQLQFWCGPSSQKVVCEQQLGAREALQQLRVWARSEGSGTVMISFTWMYMACFASRTELAEGRKLRRVSAEHAKAQALSMSHHVVRGHCRHRLRLCLCHLRRGLSSSIVFIVDGRSELLAVATMAAVSLLNRCCSVVVRVVVQRFWNLRSLHKRLKHTPIDWRHGRALGSHVGGWRAPRIRVGWFRGPVSSGP